MPSLALALASSVAGQNELPVVAELDAGDWRQRNVAAAALIDSADEIPATSVLALWAMAAPEPAMGQWPKLAVESTDWRGDAADVLRPRFVRMPDAVLVPDGRDDLVVAFSPQALATLVLLAIPGEPSADAFAVCLDRALAENRRPEGELLQRLLMRYGDRAFTALQQRLAAGTPPWTTSRPLFSLLQFLDRWGARGRSAVREAAQDHASVLVRRTALLVLGSDTRSAEDLEFAARRLLADPECASEAFGVLVQGDAFDRLAAVRVLSEAFRSPETTVRARARAAIAQWPCKGEARPEVCAEFAAILLDGAAGGEDEVLLKGLSQFAGHDLPPDVGRRLLAFAATRPPKVAAELRTMLMSCAVRDDAWLGELLADDAMVTSELRRLLRPKVAPNVGSPWFEAARDERFVAEVLAAPREDRLRVARTFASRPLLEILPTLPTYLREGLTSADPARVEDAARIFSAFPLDLRCVEAELRQAAARDTASPSVLKAFVKAFPSELPALIATGKLGVEESPWPIGPLPQDALVALLDDRNPQKRETAAVWLSMDATAVRVLAEGLWHADHRVRLWCAYGMWRLADQAPEGLRERLSARVADGKAPWGLRMDAAAALRGLRGLRMADIEVLTAVADRIERGVEPTWNSASPGQPVELVVWPLCWWDLLTALEQSTEPASPGVLVWLENAASPTDDGDHLAAKARLLRRKFGPRH